MARQCHTARDFGKDHVSWLSIPTRYAQPVSRQQDNTCDRTYVATLIEKRLTNSSLLHSHDTLGRKHAGSEAENMLSFAP
jgi:hypothetical protein